MCFIRYTINHTPKKRMSNRLYTGSTHFIAFSLCMVLLVGCAAERRYEVGIRRLASELPPQSAAAISASRRGAWLAWMGDLAAPDLYVQAADSDHALQFPISAQPRRLSVLPLADRRLVLLWLEVAEDNTARLVSATLEAEGSLRRAPFEVASADAYHALPTPNGGVIALAVNNGVLSAVPLDALGRPRAAVRLAEAAGLPAAAFDSADRLHVVWFTPSSGQLWSLMYMAFSAAQLEQPTPSLPTPIPLAVLRLEDGQFFESLSVGTDAQSVYVVWNVVSVAATGESARLAGIRFPQTASSRSTALDLSALPPNLRGVSIPAADPLQGGAPTVVGSLPPDQIAYGALTRQGVFRVRQIKAALDGERLSGSVAAALSSNNALHLAWFTLDAYGKAALQYATYPRPQPAAALN